MKRIGFYATIKPPDHPIASGDRLIARNLSKALTVAEFDVELESRFIAYSKREDDDILQQRKSAALEETRRIISRLRDVPPDVWITYHPYCKAPDWIGPKVCSALNIPYVTVEAARTGQGFENGADRWKLWRGEAQDGIVRADLHLCFKPTDRIYLNELLGPDAPIKMLAPFIDSHIPTPLPQVTHPANWRAGAPTLITTGMMRPGKKVENYRIMAHTLEQLQALHWNLVIIGGGPEEPLVREFFSRINPDRLYFAGAVPHNDVLANMAKSDLFLWPGWKEPIGMVYLEAQMMGLPVAALDSMGVSLSVHHGRTGLLSGESDLEGFRDNLSNLISHPALRRDLGTAAKRSVEHHHSLQSAASTLQQALNPLMSP